MVMKMDIFRKVLYMYVCQVFKILSDVSYL